MNFPAYPRWNPFIRCIAGKPATNKSLKVFIQPPGQSRMRFQPKVLTLIPNQAFRWKGKLLLPGLFDGEHFFRLEAGSNGGVIFIYRN